MCLWFFENHPMGSCFGSTETRPEWILKFPREGPAKHMAVFWGPAVQLWWVSFNNLLPMRNVEQQKFYGCATVLRLNSSRTVGLRGALSGAASTGARDGVWLPRDRIWV